MASKLSSLFCHEHANKKARAICTDHYELLCIECIVEKSKTGQCRIKEIEDICGEREECMLEIINLRQTVKEIVDKNSKQLSKMHEEKDNLLQQIGDLHAELARRIDEMVEECRVSIKRSASQIEHEILSDNDDLNQHDTKLKNMLDKLKDVDFEEFIVEIATIKQTLNSPYYDESEIESSFIPNEAISNCLKCGTLVDVDLIYQKHYQEVNCLGITDDTNAIATEETKQKKDEICVGSDQDFYSQKEVESDEKTKMKKKTKEIKGKGFFNFFKRKGKDDSHEHNAEKPTSVEPVSESNKVQFQECDGTIQPISRSFRQTNLINRAVKIPDIERTNFKSAPFFSKLVHLGDNFIGLLSQSYSTVLVTELPNGPTQRKHFRKHVSGIVSTGFKEISVLVGEQLNVLRLHDGKLSLGGSYVIQGTLKDVTGFDYDVTICRYAISTTSKVIILDKKGATITTISLPQPNDDTSIIRSVYNLQSDRVWYLNISLRTLKSFDCEKTEGEILWKKKFGDEDFKPRDICLYNDCLCVASTYSIASFCMTRGEPIAIYETYDILPECLAIYVTDNIAMWTSGSDDMDQSTNIGFVSLLESQS